MTEGVVAVWSGTEYVSHAVVIPADGVVLGRELLLATTDDRISRTHARIDRVDGRLVVSDAGSRNGTYVDGFLLEGRSADVAPGVVIRTGGTIWTIVADVDHVDDARRVQAIVTTVRAAATELPIHASLIERCLLSHLPTHTLLDLVAGTARARANDGPLRGEHLEVSVSKPAVWAVFPGLASAAAAARRLAAKLEDATTRELVGGSTLVEARRLERRVTIECPPSTAYVVEMYDGESLVAAGYTIEDSDVLAVAADWIAGIELRELMQKSSFLRAADSAKG